MSDERDRLGEKLHQAGMARENQWAVQRDAEILKRLREKYAKPIVCPKCGRPLSPEVAFGLGEMACPVHHGAWADNDTITQLIGRLAAVPTHHESLSEHISAGIVAGVAKMVEEIHHSHHEIDCPECKVRLGARAPVSPEAAGLSGMVCPNGHGAWIDHEMLVEIRHRLEAPKHAEHR